MKIKSSISFITFMVLLSIAPLSATAEEESPLFPQEDIRWYQVEVLIYEQGSRFVTVEEHWRDDITLSYSPKWVKLKTLEEHQAEQDVLAMSDDVSEDLPEGPQPDMGSPSPKNPEDEQKEEITEIPFIRLPKEQRNFETMAGKLRWAKNRILFHEAWRQPLTKDFLGEPTSILVRGGSTYGDHQELEGSISLSLSRYLHISTDLWMTRFAVNDSNTPVTALWPDLPQRPEDIEEQAENPFTSLDYNNNYGERNMRINFAEDTAAKQVSPYRVDSIMPFRQSRRMRSEELHFLDHPKLGLLIKVTPWPEEDDDNS